MYSNLHSNEQRNNKLNERPIMNDGRVFSTWQPESIINSRIQQQEGINSNWDYRRYLQNNAQQIMKYNYINSTIDSGNNPKTYMNNQTSSNSPFIFQSTHDSSRPNYGYNISDLKNNYLSREQLNARMIAPSIPTNF